MLIASSSVVVPFDSPDGTTGWLCCYSNVARRVRNSAERLLFELTLANFFANNSAELVVVVYEVDVLECRNRSFRPDAAHLLDRLPNFVDLRRLVQSVAAVSPVLFIRVFNDSLCYALQVVDHERL